MISDIGIQIGVLILVVTLDIIALGVILYALVDELYQFWQDRR